jgi:hypothetical protein
MLKEWMSMEYQNKLLEMKLSGRRPRGDDAHSGQTKLREM